MTRERCLHKHLSRKRALVGIMQTHFNPTLTELVGICGYDFLFLDGEHGHFRETDYLQTVQIAAALDTLVAVRLRTHSAGEIGQYMDIGVDVIVAPNVSTAKQAQMLVRAMQYPPTGIRGFGASAHRGTRYGLDLAAHLKNPRGGVQLLVIIESALGVANVEEILSVDGVDGVIIGPSDLSADLGALQDFAHPLYINALARIEAVATSNNKILGTAPHAQFSLEVLFARGHRLFIVDADVSLITDAMGRQLSSARTSIDRSANKQTRE